MLGMMVVLGESAVQGKGKEGREESMESGVRVRMPEHSQRVRILGTNVCIFQACRACALTDTTCASPRPACRDQAGRACAFVDTTCASQDVHARLQAQRARSRDQRAHLWPGLEHRGQACRACALTDPTCAFSEVSVRVPGVGVGGPACRACTCPGRACALRAP